MKRNIFITGFSGSGKTTVGREVARRLGWRFVDTDQEIARRSGRSVEQIFREDGEAGFRRLERDHLARVCEAEDQVVSTGGGIVTDERNRQLMHEAGVVVCLEAQPDVLYQRLKAQRQAGSPTVRPMLADSDPLGRIVSLKSRRQFDYSQADWTVNTDRLSPEDAAEEVVRAWSLLSRRSPAEPWGEHPDLSAVVRTSSGDYPVWVGWGILGELGERVRRSLSPGAAYVVSDEGAHRHARRAQVSMEEAGVPTHLFLVPPGERSKTLETGQHLYDWLAGRRAERGHLMVAVGGGMVGDLAGFVAATYLRGMHLVQVPTTLLAMMDAAIGGKTAVDMPQGKNLVGTFYQPRFVLEDVQTLQSLPGRETASGWAEAIKHGLILDEGLLTLFEEERAAILGLDRRVSTEVIRRSAAVKAGVVSKDEKETLGVRVLLNYGHTIGHAIEAATEYRRYLHGEAVSVGMMGAALISGAMGMFSQQEIARQRAILEGFGLPVACEGVDIEAVRHAMSMDKKTSEGAIRWVLLEGIGRATTRQDVPEDIVESTLMGLCR